MERQHLFSARYCFANYFETLTRNKGAGCHSGSHQQSEEQQQEDLYSFINMSLQCWLCFDWSLSNNYSPSSPRTRPDPFKKSLWCRYVSETLKKWSEEQDKSTVLQHKIRQSLHIIIIIILLLLSDHKRDPVLVNCLRRQLKPVKLMLSTPTKARRQRPTWRQSTTNRPLQCKIHSNVSFMSSFSTSVLSCCFASSFSILPWAAQYFLQQQQKNVTAIVAN